MPRKANTKSLVSAILPDRVGLVSIVKQGVCEFSFTVSAIVLIAKNMGKNDKTIYLNLRIFTKDEKRTYGDISVFLFKKRR